MLKEFIQAQKYPPPKDLSEYTRSIVTAFDRCIDFLRDPKRFSNNKINAVTTLMWNLVRNREIPVAIDQWSEFPSLSFIVLMNKKLEQTPALIIPTDFLQQINEDPVFQLGVISYMASQCRDFYCGKIAEDNREVNARAQAFEAETLLTLQEMATREQVVLSFGPLQHKYLATFPNGLKSMPQGMNYATPVYIQPPTNPGNN